MPGPPLRISSFTPSSVVGLPDKKLFPLEYALQRRRAFRELVMAEPALVIENFAPAIRPVISRLPEIVDRDGTLIWIGEGGLRRRGLSLLHRSRCWRLLDRIRGTTANENARAREPSQWLPLRRRILRGAIPCCHSPALRGEVSSFFGGVLRGHRAASRVRYGQSRITGLSAAICGCRLKSLTRRPGIGEDRKRRSRSYSPALFQASSARRQARREYRSGIGHPLHRVPLSSVAPSTGASSGVRGRNPAQNSANSQSRNGRN